MKIDNAEIVESSEEKKTEETPAEKEADKPAESNASVAENKREEESLSNGNGEAEPCKTVEDVEMKSASEINEKKCISSESQEEKTEDDAARTEVKT